MTVARLIFVPAALLSVLVATAAVPGAQTDQPVTLDVVVLDGNGKPVSGLTQDRFEVRDDGSRVTIQSFQEVKVEPGKRVVSFVLDDVGVPAAGTAAIQNIAKALVSNAQPGDNVSVLHLSAKGQGIENDPATVMGRIESYIAGSARVTPDAAADATSAIADLADKLQPLGAVRKTIVCIGSTGACNVAAPRQNVDNMRMSSWNRVISSTARANAAVYVVVPSTTVSMTGASLSEATGGDALAVANNLAPVADRVWGDGSNHYMLTYQPTTKNARDLYRIEVRVEGRGLRALARGYRGR